jgi:peptide/nickel transport system permease protein
MAMVSLAFLTLLAVAALSAYVAEQADLPFPFRPNETDTANKFHAPGWPHVMGTDQYGRDVFSRVLNASYISLTIGLVAVGISITVGLLIGSIAGYFGGWTDNILMRFVDTVISIPRFLLVLTIVAVSGTQSIFILIAAIGLLGWMGTSRLVRAEFLTLRETDYVASARALGASPWRIIFRHILPNALAPVFVSAVLGVAGAILTEAGLSFLGFGVQQPQASWGNIISDGKEYLLDAWWLIIFPGVAILVTTMAFYLVGEGIREVLDPKESKRI